MEFGIRMRTLRAALGLAQKELAVRATVPNTSLSDIETGKMLPSPAWEQRVRAALQWTPPVDSALDQLAGALSLESTKEAA